MTYFDGPELRPHDEQCERGTYRPQLRRCRCHHRLRARSVELKERPVAWPWLHGPAPEEGS